MQFFPCLAVFAIFFPQATAVRMNVELSERYRKYAECLRRRQLTTGGDGALHLQSLEVVRGSDVVLPCFTCVAPEDAIEIEHTYKPSAGSIGRAVKKVVDFFRRKLLGGSAVYQNKWTYDWEISKPGGFGWESLTNVHAKKNFLEHVSTKVRRFLNRDDALWTLGDQFELRLRSVDRNNSAFYRCINKRIKGPKSSEARMGALYFLDVRTKIPWLMEQSNEPMAIPQRVKDLIPTKTEKDLRIGPKASLWSTCSQCGNRMGEQLRRIDCWISSAGGRLSQLGNDSAWLKLPGSVACSSSLAPLKLRQRYSFPKVIQYRRCWDKCHRNETTDRYIEATDELGERRVMDYVPKGEFIFGEILPKLLPPIIRRGYLVIEGDPTVLTCDVDPAEGVGVHWHSKSELDLNISRIIEKFHGRVWMDEQSRLIFDRTELSDQDMYYCYSSERILIGVHNLMIQENEGTKELIKTFEMVFKFTILVFIMVFIVTKLLG